MSDETEVPTTIATALASVRVWRQQAGKRHQTELDEVDQEMESLRQAVTNLQQQIKALEEYGKNLRSNTANVEQEEVLRSHNAIFDVLKRQSKGISERAKQMTELQSQHEEQLSQAMKDPAISSLMEEYQQFKTTVEPTLTHLPESYRKVLLAHHEQVVARLQQHIANASSLPEVQGDPLEVEVVFSVDEQEDEPGLLMLVLPVIEGVYSRWSEREEDIETHLTARVVQAVYTAFRGSTLEGAPAAFGGHQGILALEIEVPPSDTATLRDSIQSALDTVLADAPELKSAKIQALARFVSVDHLLPPETDAAGS